MEKLDIAETGFTKNLEELCDDLDKRKDNLARHLKKNYKKNIHYKIEQKKINIGRGGGNQKTYLLTDEAFNLLKNTFNLRNNYVVNLTDNVKCVNIGMCIENQTIGFIENSYKNVFYTKRQYRIDKYKVDLCFTHYKLVIECDENNHIDRDPIEEKIREDYILSSGYKMIRYNPNAEDFDLSNIINKINAILLENYTNNFEEYQDLKVDYRDLKHDYTKLEYDYLKLKLENRNLQLKEKDDLIEQQNEVIEQQKEVIAKKIDNKTKDQKICALTEENEELKKQRQFIARNLETGKEIIFNSYAKAHDISSIGPHSLKDNYLNKPKQSRGWTFRTIGHPYWQPPENLKYNTAFKPSTQMRMCKSVNIKSGEVTYYNSCIEAAYFIELYPDEASDKVKDTLRRKLTRAISGKKCIDPIISQYEWSFIETCGKWID